MNLLLPLLCCAALQTPTTWSPAQQHIIDRGAQWSAAYQAGDLEALMQHYVDDAFVALHGQPALKGKPAISAYFAPRLGQSDVSFDLRYERVRIYGDVAYIISQYWLTATDRNSGATVRDAGRSLLVYELGSDGQWRIAADIDQATPDVTFTP